MNIYISKNNQTLGPYNEEQITQMIDTGSIGAHDMCSLDGSAWQHVSDFIQIDEQPASPPEQSQAPKPKPINQTKSSKQSAKKFSSTKAKKPRKDKPRKQAGKAHTQNIQSGSYAVSSKEKYLASIRNDTLYPNLRKFLKILFIISLVLGLLTTLGGLVSIPEIRAYSLLPITGGLFIIFLSFAGKESAEVLIDIADSLIETNSKKK